MKNGIIETNIFAGANGIADHLSEEEKNECILFISKYIKDSITYIDTSNAMFSEYKKYCSFSGKPNIGDYFFKWLWDNQNNKQKCTRVEIHPLDDKYFDFRELAQYKKLKKFDKSDKKFIAVCIAAEKVPTIYNACDSDWDEYKEVFDEYDITIEKIL
jgi:hypothetical protein